MPAADIDVGKPMKMRGKPDKKEYFIQTVAVSTMVVGNQGKPKTTCKLLPDLPMYSRQK